MKKSEINVLLVEDDNSLRSSLTEAIKKMGFKVSATGKVDEAANLVKIKPFQAAVIDCMLPRTNGVDLSLQFRSSRFGNAPIILMSGVFKDKSFAAEAIEKSKAVAFLHKPFNISQLKELLESSLKDLLSDEKVPLQVLVSRPFASARERTKVIEGLEEIKGFDLPFVLCVLMDANAGGHLNIANGSGEVFGITFSQGKIVKVDSSESLANLSLALIEKGYVTPEDLKAISKSRRGDLITNLIEQQMLSPHLMPALKKEQILLDLERLFVDESVKINFVPDRVKEEGVQFSIEDLTPLLDQVIDKVITPEHITQFYQDWLEFPVHCGPQFDAGHPIFKIALFKQLPDIAEFFKGQMTLSEMLEKGRYDRILFFKALHLLVLRRLIIFDDVKKTRGAQEYGERMRAILKQLQGKNPFEVFRYFGVSPECKEADVVNMYKEFSRANHPDLLPPNSPQELREVVNQVFSIVSEAHNVLSQSDKRTKLVNDLKMKDAERQIQAETLAEEAVNLLKHGRIQEAVVKTREALTIYPSRNIKLAHVWALLKSSSGDHTKEANELLESIPHEERRNAQHVFLMGLLKKQLGDIPGAIAQFEKAMAMDPLLLDARREKSSLTAQKQGQKGDLFNADLTSLVGNFFKRKR